MNARRPSGSLLLSVAVHAVIGVVLLNMAFHYDIISLPRASAPAPTVERITYVRVAPIAGGGAVGGASTGAPAKAARPNVGLIAPPSVPTSVAAPQPAAGTPGGVDGGTGSGGGIGPATGIVPGVADPRLSVDPRQFYPVPKTQAQRTDSAIQAIIFAYNDSVAKASGGRQPGDWTFEKGGKKYGVDSKYIHLGPFSIPTAVLAMLPLNLTGNPTTYQRNKTLTANHDEIFEQAQRGINDADFEKAVRSIRERKERERKEAEEIKKKAAEDARSEP